jgi:hypothetical protein
VKSDTRVLESNTKRTANFVSDLRTNWQSWQTTSPVDWSIALEREAIIRPLAEQLRLSQAIIDDEAKQLHLSLSPRLAPSFSIRFRYMELAPVSDLSAVNRPHFANYRFYVQRDKSDETIAFATTHFTVRPDNTPVDEFLSFKVSPVGKVKTRTRVLNRSTFAVIHDVEFDCEVGKGIAFHW